VKTIALVLYRGITPLDLVGPLQVLAQLPLFDEEYETVVVAERLEPYPTDTALSVQAGRTFAEVPAPYAVIVPGGMEPTLRAMADEPLLGYLRRAARTAELVGSVCTGSLILAAAGLLEGRRATSHWMYLDRLARWGATPVSERWVEDGPVLTAAGVSAGIDMALALAGRLAGPEAARLIQLYIEYDQQPPFGGLDWSAVDIASYAAFVDGQCRSALAGHPELLERMVGREGPAGEART
jgi:transcriptional regulator GlxA family with amidase domain